MVVTSGVFPVVVQRAVKLNRLVHQASVLQNHTVVLSCRVNVGTNVTFLWSFGDGTSRSGESTERHVFHRWEFNKSLCYFKLELVFSNSIFSSEKLQVNIKITLPTVTAVCVCVNVFPEQESSESKWRRLTWSALLLWAAASLWWTSLVSLHPSKTWGLLSCR